MEGANLRAGVSHGSSRSQAGSHLVKWVVWKAVGLGGESEPGEHTLNKRGHSPPALVHHCHMAKAFKTSFRWKPIQAPNSALGLPVLTFSALKQGVAHYGLWANNDFFIFMMIGKKSR